MSKRLVEIDDELLDHARRAAGTPTIRATVEAGLRRLVESDLAVRHVEFLRGGGLDLEMAERARSPRSVSRG